MCPLIELCRRSTTCKPLMGALRILSFSPRKTYRAIITEQEEIQDKIKMALPCHNLNCHLVLSSRIARSKVPLGLTKQKNGNHIIERQFLVSLMLWVPSKVLMLFCASREDCDRWPSAKGDQLSSYRKQRLPSTYGRHRPSSLKAEEGNAICDRDEQASGSSNALRTCLHQLYCKDQ